MKLKKLTALALAGAMTLALAACAPSGDAGGKSVGHAPVTVAPKDS